MSHSFTILLIGSIEIILSVKNVFLFIYMDFHTYVMADTMGLEPWKLDYYCDFGGLFGCYYVI